MISTTTSLTLATAVRAAQLRHCSSIMLPRCIAAALLLAALALTANPALAATVWNGATTNWSVAGNWNNGLPAGGNPGTINSGVAIANAQLAGADITVNSGGAIRIQTVGNVASSVLINSGGILQYENAGNTNPGGTTLTFANGARIGKNVTNNLANSKDAITIGAGVTLMANFIRADGRAHIEDVGLVLRGAFDGAGTLHVQPTLNSDAALILHPDVADNPFTGTAIVEGGAGAPGYLILRGTGALRNATDIDVRAGGVLRFESAVDPIGLPEIDIPNGARMDWNGTTTYTATPPQINFFTGSALSKWRLNGAGVSNETIAIADGNTLTTGFLRSDGRIEDDSTMLRLAGSLEGDTTTTLRVQPDASVSHISSSTSGVLEISPAALTNPFEGSVIVQGNLNGARGILSLGSGALDNATGLTVNAGGTLRFMGNPVNPLDTSKIPSVTISGGARAEWQSGATGSSYTGSMLVLNMADGSSIGKRRSNTFGVARETLALAAGTITADEIYATSATEALALTLAGNLTGGAAARLLVQPSSLNSTFRGALIINPTAAGGNTGFSGTVEVLGQAATARPGVLVLRGVKPIGSGQLIVGEEGIVDVRSGSLNDAGGVTLRGTGELHFRNTGGSTLANTTLAGSGLVRAESTPANTSVDLTTDVGALQALTLNNVVLAPGESLGELTIQATTLTLNAASQLHIEIGNGVSDLLVVEGDLNLTALPTLVLSDLGDADSGEFVIATYSGNLTGQFGNIELDPMFILNSISYTGGQISVNLTVLVPEPSTMSMLTLACVGLLRRRRKNQG